MESLEYCARQAVQECLGFKSGERAAIIYDQAASRIAGQIINVAREISPENVEFYLMENYGERPDNGINPLKFPGEISDALKEVDVSFFVSGDTRRGERESFRHPMLEIVNSNPKLRHAHMPGITEEVFLGGMSVDYPKLREITRKVNKVVKNSRQVRVTTPAGSDFTAQFSPNYNWVISDGFITKERWGNLPGSETFTCPITINGKIVVDGVLGDYFDQKYGLLHKSPVIIKAKDGRIDDLTCPNNRTLESEFKEYIKRDENANRFGEFAIGTNVGLERLLGNMLHDEKFPGVHVAVGHPYPEETGAEWDSGVHCDMVMRKCSIYVDGQQIMSKGKFSPQLL